MIHTYADRHTYLHSHGRRQVVIKKSKYTHVHTHTFKNWKLHYITPRGKFILSPQEKRQGVSVLKSHPKDYRQKLTY